MRGLIIVVVLIALVGCTETTQTSSFTGNPSLAVTPSLSTTLRIISPDVTKITTGFTNYTIIGETEPGAIAKINGQKANVSSDGSFQHTVPLVLGLNTYLVEAEEQGFLENQKTVVIFGEENPDTAPLEPTPTPTPSSEPSNSSTIPSSEPSNSSAIPSSEFSKWVLTDAEIEEAIRVGESFADLRALGDWQKQYQLVAKGGAFEPSTVKVSTPFIGAVTLAYSAKTKYEDFSLEKVREAAIENSLSMYVTCYSDDVDFTDNLSAVLILNDGTVIKPYAADVPSVPEVNDMTFEAFCAFHFATTQIKSDERITFVLIRGYSGEQRAEIDLSQLK